MEASGGGGDWDEGVQAVACSPPWPLQYWAKGSSRPRLTGLRTDAALGVSHNCHNLCQLVDAQSSRLQQEAAVNMVFCNAWLSF